MLHQSYLTWIHIRDGSRAASTSTLEHQPLTIITKRSILDVAEALDPPLTSTNSTWIIQIQPQLTYACSKSEIETLD